MNCPNCGIQLPDSANMCYNCKFIFNPNGMNYQKFDNNSMYSNFNNQGQAQQQGYQGSRPLYQQQGYQGNGPAYQQPYNRGVPPVSYTNNNPPKKHISVVVIILVAMAVIVLGLVIWAFVTKGSRDGASDDSSSKSKQKVTSSTTESKTERKTEAKTEKKTTESTTEATTEASSGTYEENQYYDIVEETSYSNSIGDTIVIHKVMAKQDVSVDATIIAYDEDGNVIDKASSDVELTKGKYNYFKYYFDGDISNASLEATATAKDPSWMIGDRDAVEMEKYNVSGNDLYITFKQTGNEIGSFAKYKLLFYKDGQIVGSEEGYFSVSAQNLNGKGSTDVAEIWIYGEEFDEIEYMYEP